MNETLDLDDRRRSWRKAVLLARRVEQVHGRHAQFPVGLARAIEAARHDVAPLAVMRRLTKGYAPPPDACRAWRVLYALVERFEDDSRLESAEKLIELKRVVMRNSRMGDGTVGR